MLSLLEGTAGQSGTLMVLMLFAAWIVMALCVLIHAAGVTWVLRSMRRRVPAAHALWAWIGVFVRAAGWIIFLHLAEIMLWAGLYAWREAMPDLQSALYFSAVTYTTTGYGDLVLPAEWRLVGAIEALTGILMCGWSTGFLFAVISRMLSADSGSLGHAP